MTDNSDKHLITRHCVKSIDDSISISQRKEGIGFRCKADTRVAVVILNNADSLDVACSVIDFILSECPNDRDYIYEKLNGLLSGSNKQSSGELLSNGGW